MKRDPGVSPGFFPAAADPGKHLASVPYARALGFVWDAGEARRARIRLPLTPAAATEDGRAIDTLAVLGLLDHVCSASVYLALEAPSLIATIDLRCEFVDSPQAGSDVVAEAKTLHQADGFAIVRGQALSAASGRVIAYCSSAYAIGAHPGMQDRPVRARPPAAPGEPDESGGPAPAHGFARVLGLQATPRGLEMPFCHHLVGALSLPAVHGGATAAALATSALALAGEQVDPDAKWRLLTIDVHYLRAVESRTTSITPTLRKRSRRSCLVSVTASQGCPAREVSFADCLLSRH